MKKGKAWNHQYPFGSIYSTGSDQDFDIVELGKRTPVLTVDEEFLNPKFKLDDPARTIFKEIRLLQPKEKINPDYEYLLKPMSRTLYTLPEFAAALKRSLKDYFLKVWDSKKKHLVFHSSGFDSRIMSLILQELKQEEGAEWLGKIHFRCHGNENPLFLHIMERQGWDKSEYSIFDAPDLDYYDMGHPERPVNGFTSYCQQMNWWRDFMSYEDQKEWVLMTGLGGGELFNYTSRDIKVQSKNHHCDNPVFNTHLNFFAGRGEWTAQWHNEFSELLLPFFSYDYLKYALRMRPEFLKMDKGKGKTDAIRTAILDLFDTDYSDIAYDMHRYPQTMSEGRKKIIMDSYYNSKFYADFGHLKHLKKINPLLPRKGGLHHFDLKAWGFMTVYDAIMEGRDE